MPLKPPKLFVVATPLGNPGDLSPRAAEILGNVQVILAEDTRRAGLLCQRLGITPSRFVSLHEHNEEARLAEVLALFEAGEDIALVSDAGTPLLSDPGYRLVRACRREGVEVVPIPGPSAMVAALSACGLPPYPFTFLGFPPRKRQDKRRLFEEFGSSKATLVFFERKTRLAETLDAAFDALGPRELCIARELTKPHEEFIVGRLENRQAIPSDLLGEITVVIGPPEAGTATDEATVLTLCRKESASGGRPRDVAARVKEQVVGWTTKTIYQLMMHRDEKEEGDG